MSLVGLLSTDKHINKQIQAVLKNEKKYDSHIEMDFEKILEFLNFDLPELVILNLTDAHINVEKIIDAIHNDSWLHNFGIIGIFNRKTAKEEELMQKLRGINILSMLDYSKISSHLGMLLEIIEANRQIIFQHELTSSLVDTIGGSFIIKNDPLAANVYAGLAANALSSRGLLNDEIKIQLHICLTELILNGIEHGNCHISKEEKAECLLAGESIIDLIMTKCQDPEIAAKRVIFEWNSQESETVFLIRDEGKGFDVAAMAKKLQNQDPSALNGRGILMARSMARKLSYNKKGNQVTLVFPHRQAGKKTPLGFSGEELLSFKEGDILFKQGESSDFLYYISSGRYSVFHNGRRVGMLSPADIFMGEMSFLLNNKRSASVKTEIPGKLVKISRKAFVQVIKEYPHYGIFLSKLLARKLVRANARNARR